jgi:NADH-quinone oxidoreductase subunit H
MALALVAVLMYSGRLTMTGIVARQAGYFHPLSFIAWLDWVVLPKWNLFTQFPAFVIYLIAGLAETNRPPFDLAEAETELVAGFHTEYSGIKFAMFYLGEYVNTVTVAAIATTLFLGGWRGPHPGFLPWLWPILWFLLKVFVIIYLYIWVRATFPRVRYDRLMAFGWKVLIPVGLAWVLATGAVIVLPDVYGRKAIMIGGVILAGVLVVITLIWPLIVPDRSGREVAS